MKKILRLLFFFIVVSYLSSCVSTKSSSITVIQISPVEFSQLVGSPRQLDGFVPEDDEDPSSERAKKKPDVGYVAVQVDVMVPDFSDYVYYDAILPNNYYSFTAFKNNCEVFFDASGIHSFTCYINDTKIDTTEICKLGFCKVNISALVENGRNIIYLSNVSKKNNNSRLAVRIPYPTITESTHTVSGINYAAFKLLDEILKAEVENGFPSLQLVVVKDGVMIKNTSYGTIYDAAKYSPEPAKVTRKTLYDLASNTKMYASLFAIQRLVFEQKISIHDKVQDFFPSFADAKNASYTGKSEMTIEHLLTHSSGFPAGGAYYGKSVVKNASEAERRAITLEQILTTRLISNVGTSVLYSDINFMLLSFIVEKVTEMDFDVYVEQNIYEPLGLDRICFKPTEHGFSLDEIAATEQGLNRSKAGERFRGFAHGHVHDPESFVAMNEVSGHAGLFANAETLSILAQVIINGGGYGNIRLFDRETVNTFLGPSQYGNSYALGWRMQNIDAYRWAFSTMASPRTVGHTGWTGTLTLIDTENNVSIILLTNAKHSKYVASQKYEGDYYLIKNYGAITSIIYSAFFQTDMDYFSSLLIELATKKYEMTITQKNFNNPGSHKDLNAIMQVIKKRSKVSKTLRDFLKTNTAKEITKFLENNLK